MHALRLLALGMVFLLLLGRIATMEQKVKDQVSIEYRTAWGLGNRNLIRGDSKRSAIWLRRRQFNRRHRLNYRN